MQFNCIVWGSCNYDAVYNADGTYTVTDKTNPYIPKGSPCKAIPNIFPWQAYKPVCVNGITQWDQGSPSVIFKQSDIDTFQAKYVPNNLASDGSLNPINYPAFGMVPSQLGMLAAAFFVSPIGSQMIGESYVTNVKYWQNVDAHQSTLAQKIVDASTLVLPAGMDALLAVEGALANKVNAQNAVQTAKDQKAAITALQANIDNAQAIQANLQKKPVVPNTATELANNVKNLVNKPSELEFIAGAAAIAKLLAIV